VGFTPAGEVFRQHRERFDMATRNAAVAGIGGPPGTNPIGDRPGTTSLGATQTAWGTPAGRAHVYALAALAAVIFLHMAAESRFR
jgi:hypothetical protein